MKDPWEYHLPRIEDYWETFSSPYRDLVSRLVDKHTPLDGSVMDFGCGVGVQTFLMRQRRPDILIHAVDCNKQARNLTRVLLGGDERVIVADTPKFQETVPQVDTIVSIFTCAYLEPEECGRILEAFCQKAKTVILAELTTYADEIQPFHGLPCGGYMYPYKIWLERLGWRTEMELVDGPVNAITVGTKGAA